MTLAEIKGRQVALLNWATDMFKAYRDRREMDEDTLEAAKLIADLLYQLTVTTVEMGNRT